MHWTWIPHEFAIQNLKLGIEFTKILLIIVCDCIFLLKATIMIMK